MKFVSIISVLKSKKLSMIALIGSFCFFSTMLQAKESESVSVEEKYGAAMKAYQSKEYKLVIEDAKFILQTSPASPIAAEVSYMLGVSYFQLKDFDLSNHYFSLFLEKYATPKYFEDAIVYKYRIASEYEKGAGRHMFGLEQMPKWVNAWEDAYELYEEVIKTLPNHEIASMALYQKAGMLMAEGKSKEALESYRLITRRFPKNPLAPESYLAIAKCYFAQSKQDFPDNIFLQQARLNLKNFAKDFPSEERLDEAKALLVQMQDSYAKDLWVSAQYFERKKKHDAARLYYEKIARLYPESSYAKDAIAKLSMKDISMKDATITVVDQKEENTNDSQKQVSDSKIDA